MRLLGFFFFVLTMLLAGCDQAEMVKKITPAEAESTARGYIDLLRQNRFEEIEKDLDPVIKTPDIRSTLHEMAQMIPAQKPESIKVVGVQVNTFKGAKGPETTTTNITFEYQFQSRWLLINVATRKAGGESTVVGFNVNPIPDSLDNLNKFRLSGKSPLQYSVLFLALILPLFTLYVLIICIRTKMERRKWLWVLFVLFGFAKFSIDWATGQWGVSPLSFQLFSASAFAPPYGSWTISISLPLGAILFLLKRKGLTERQETKPVLQQSPEKEDWLGDNEK